MEADCRSFLWIGDDTNKKKALVAWEKVCVPKKQGGLGLFNLDLWNLAAVGKLLWALCKRQEQLLIQWVHAYYIRKIMQVAMRSCCMF